MTVSELRIGNYFSDGVNILIVRKLEDYPSMKFAEVNNTEIIDIKPIPLTEEWLVRFGFKLYGEKEYHGNGLYPILVWDNGFWLDDNETGTINDNPILYVHQLQNIHFALTGRELTC